MAIQSNPYPLRIDKSLMQKFKVIAALHGRSVNKEIEFTIRTIVAAYEKENGESTVSLDE